METHNDDSTIWEASSSSGIVSSLQVAADEVGPLTASNKMALNYDKTKERRICFKKSTPDIALLTIDGRPIQQVKSTRLLSVTWGGGAREWRRAVETGGGDGRWRRAVETAMKRDQ